MPQLMRQRVAIRIRIIALIHCDHRVRATGISGVKAGVYRYTTAGIRHVIYHKDRNTPAAIEGIAFSKRLCIVPVTPGPIAMIVEEIEITTAGQ